MKLKLTQSNARFLSLTLMFTLTAFLLPPTSSFADEADSADTQATVTFLPGQLTLTAVPALDFGSQTISGNTETYQAHNIADNIQVSDLRGSGVGWALTASLSEFKLTEGDAVTLQGAYITVTDQNITPLNNYLSEPPTALNTVSLTAGSASVRILAADYGNGMGVWNDGWDIEHTSLTVLPGTAQLGTSFATINWNLQDTP